jgi:uncharacterized heparinase superfamily protein
VSLLERVDAGSAEEEFDPGKRPPRTSGSFLRRLIPFRFGRQALKLAAVPKDPVAGDKAVGDALLRGSIVHGGESVTIETLDFAGLRVSPAMADYLHSFAWLRDLAAAATREKGARLAEKIARHWLEAYADGRDESVWRADLWGRRILFWAAYAPYILSSRDMAHRGVLLGTLARGARHLDKRADKLPPGLPRVTAWAGLVASALLLQSGPTRAGRAEAGLLRALAGALHEDGGLVSRSPVEQLALVEFLGQLRAVYFAGRRAMPDVVQDALGGSVAALLSVTLGDEALSSWQGGSTQSRRRIAAAIEGSGVRARALRQARGWGYQQMDARGSILVFDGAPPPALRGLTGGCASTLAFEFSDGANRLVVNCGGEAPWSGALPAELTRLLRYTAAHSTLTLGDRNSTAILEGGGLGKGVSAVELKREEESGGERIEASHDGYLRRFGLVHERQLTLAADGRALSGDDHLLPKGRKRRSEPVPFAARFHLAPAVEVTSTADGQGALLRIRGGNAWQFRCRGGALDIEESLWVDAVGRPHATSQLVIAGEVPPDGAAITWQFRRAG